MRDWSLRCLLRSVLPKPPATERPMSTDGPSGPNEAPVPNVRAAEVAFSSGCSNDCALDPTKNN